MRPDVAWAALLGAGCALEAWALTTDRQHWTLSRVSRRWLRADTPAGRALIVSGVGAGATALAHHLIAMPTD